jgi:hypothetical protein
MTPPSLAILSEFQKLVFGFSMSPNGVRCQQKSKILVTIVLMARGKKFQRAEFIDPKYGTSIALSPRQVFFLS